VRPACRRVEAGDVDLIHPEDVEQLACELRVDLGDLARFQRSEGQPPDGGERIGRGCALLLLD
jgi:hypothetical protein